MTAVLKSRLQCAAKANAGREQNLSGQPGCRIHSLTGMKPRASILAVRVKKGKCIHCSVCLETREFLRFRPAAACTGNITTQTTGLAEGYV